MGWLVAKDMSWLMAKFVFDVMAKVNKRLLLEVEKKEGISNGGRSAAADLGRWSGQSQHEQQR